MTSPKVLLSPLHGDQQQHIVDIVNLVRTALENPADTGDAAADIANAIGHACGEHTWYAIGLLTALLGKLNLSADALFALADDTYGTSLSG